MKIILARFLGEKSMDELEIPLHKTGQPLSVTVDELTDMDGEALSGIFVEERVDLPFFLRLAVHHRAFPFF